MQSFHGGESTLHGYSPSPFYGYSAKIALFLIFFIFFISGKTIDGGVRVKRLNNLSYGNSELMKLRGEVARNLRSSASQGTLERPLRVVRYRIRKGEHFFYVMARTSQNVDTLASLNRIANPNALASGDVIYVPNARGLFKSGDRKKLAKKYGIAPELLIKHGRRWFIPRASF